MNCRCGDVEEIHGDDAVAYAEQHLTEVESQPGGQWLWDSTPAGRFAR